MVTETRENGLENSIESTTSSLAARGSPTISLPPRPDIIACDQLGTTIRLGPPFEPRFGWALFFIEDLNDDATSVACSSYSIAGENAVTREPHGKFLQAPAAICN
jgi:hypothetical protein